MFSMGFGVQSPPVWHFWVDDFLLPCRWDSSLEGTQSPIFRCQWKSQLMQLYFSFHLEYLIPFVKLDFPLSFLFGKKHRGNVWRALGGELHIQLQNTETEGNPHTDKATFSSMFSFFFWGGVQKLVFVEGLLCSCKYTVVQSLNCQEIYFLF